MASRFLMQIIERDSDKVVARATFEPGLQVERDFVEDCVERTVRLGVGLGRTSAQVEAAIRQGITEAILALKAKVQP